MDIVALPRREKIAIEMNPGHVVENIKKGLAAGFNSVVSLLEDPRAIDRVGESLSKETDEHPQEVVVGDLRDFAEILSPLLFPEASRLAARNQNGEPRRQRKRLPRLVPKLRSQIGLELDVSRVARRFTELCVGRVGLRDTRKVSALAFRTAQL